MLPFETALPLASLASGSGGEETALFDGLGGSGRLPGAMPASPGPSFAANKALRRATSNCSESFCFAAAFFSSHFRRFDSFFCSFLFFVRSRLFLAVSLSSVSDVAVEDVELSDDVDEASNVVLFNVWGGGMGESADGNVLLVMWIFGNPFVCSSV